MSWKANLFLGLLPCLLMGACVTEGGIPLHDLNHTSSEIPGSDYGDRSSNSDYGGGGAQPSFGELSDADNEGGHTDEEGDEPPNSLTLKAHAYPDYDEEREEDEEYWEEDIDQDLGEDEGYWDEREYPEEDEKVGSLTGDWAGEEL